ncbi:MAG TPA: M48 family metalloprotease [Burkholderiales bacterium]|jgi:Zn-dependent protease with chaperone function|nr:M48 family metalloprotease [Burkholderiales bacterium]
MPSRARGARAARRAAPGTRAAADGPSGSYAIVRAPVKNSREKSLTYFENQLAARRRAGTALLLYAAALVVLAVAVDLLLGLVWRYGFPEIYGARVPGALYFWGALLTVLAVVGMTLWQALRMREGGESIARLLGARRVLPETRDTLERRLVNIAEEMAIAAGTPVPALYIMDNEPGVNVLVVTAETLSPALMLTRGALQTLNRDELAGVMAHEFSRVVKGEAQAGLRTVALLSGLAALPYAGRMCAGAIKAALARGSALSADAASAEFTGNPIGIAGALDQIRACAAGAVVKARHADALSHLFLDACSRSWAPAAGAVHPPLEERIRRVLPSFASADYRARRAKASAEDRPAPARPTLAEGKRATDQAHRWWRTPEESLGLVGALYSGKVDYARRLMEALPVALREALRRRDSSPAVTLALFLAAHLEVREQQIAAARAAGAGPLAEAAAKLAPEVTALSPELRLPAIELALPTLKLVPNEARRMLLSGLEAVIRSDRRVSLQAFILLAWLEIALGPGRHAGAASSLGQLRGEATLVLSLLARGTATGAGSAQEVEAAFRAGAKLLEMPDAVLVAREALSTEACSAALGRLRGLSWPARAQLMRGLFAAVAADGKVRMSEAELMRVIGACLDCPMPPLLEAL